MALRALVTGGAGFIGSNLADRLLADGYDVTIVDNLSTGRKANLNPKAQFVEGDIIDMDFAALGKHNVVFHLAALARIQPSIADPVGAHKTNVLGALRVLDAAAKWKARVVFSSTCAIYGSAAELPTAETATAKPENPYALQKYIVEQYAQLFAKLYDLETVCLRYFNVFGERQLVDGAYAAVIGIFLDQQKQGKPFTIVGDGEQRRDFVHVSDVVAANIAASKIPLPEKFAMMNIGTGTNLSVNELAAMLDRKHDILHLPERKGECRETKADNRKAKEFLDWSPRTAMADWLANRKTK